MSGHVQSVRGQRVPWRLVALAVGVACVARVAECGEPEALERQVRYLSEALAGAKAENDALRARLDRRRFEEAGEAGTVTEVGRTGNWEKSARVLEANEELGIVVLNAGRRQGVKPGLRLTAVRGDVVVAVLRVIDVRAAVSGAVVEETRGTYPRARDRVMPASGTRD